jgi:hypothetical protein
MTQWDSISSYALKSLKGKTTINASKGANPRTCPRLLAFILKIKFVPKFGLPCMPFQSMTRVDIVEQD